MKDTPQVIRPATRKQKEFARIIATEPKTTQRQAYIQAYNVKPTTKPQSVDQQASQAYRKPQVQMELAKYNNQVESILYNTMTEWSTHERPRQREISTDIAKFMHDKIHGKAKQQIDMHSTSVKLSIDLTGNTIDQQNNKTITE